MKIGCSALSLSLVIVWHLYAICNASWYLILGYFRPVSGLLMLKSLVWPGHHHPWTYHSLSYIASISNDNGKITVFSYRSKPLSRLKYNWTKKNTKHCFKGVKMILIWFYIIIHMFIPNLTTMRTLPQYRFWNRILMTKFGTFRAFWWTKRSANC